MIHYNEYVIRRVCEEHLSDICYLFKNVHNIVFPIDELKNKLNTQRFGSSFIGYLAYDADNNPVAHYCVFPLLLNDNGNVFLGAQSGDTMTHKHHRKKGLFILLAKLTFELCEQNGISVIYGIPNYNSYQGLKKLGWYDCGHMIRYQHKFKLPIWKKFMHKFLLSFYFKFFSKIYAFRLNKKLKKLRKFNSEVFERNFNKNDAFGVSRNADYFQYKSTKNTFFIELKNGFIIFKLTDVVVEIGDYCLKKEATEKDFHLELIDIINGTGFESIIFEISPNSKKIDMPFYIASQGLPLMLHNLSSFKTKYSTIHITTLDYDTF